MMAKDNGRSPTGPGYPAEPKVSSLRAGIPSAVIVTQADAIAFIESALRNWRNINLDRDDFADLHEGLQMFAVRIAQAIEAQRAETGTGSVHESAVRQDAPNPSGEVA